MTLQRLWRYANEVGWISPMIGDETRNHRAKDVNSAEPKATTSFHELCESISKLDARIAGAIIIRNGKLLATSIGTGAPIPSDEYLTRMIMQAQVMVGIPLANKNVFGGFNFTLVSHQHLETILFYLQRQNAVVGIGALPPYDRNGLLDKIQNLLKGAQLQNETE